VCSSDLEIIYLVGNSSGVTRRAAKRRLSNCRFHCHRSKGA
jgi:hypothetical protein